MCIVREAVHDDDASDNVAVDVGRADSIPAGIAAMGRV